MYRSGTFFPPLQRQLLAALAAILLLFIQAMVLEHRLELDHHHDDETCELCLHLATADQAPATTSSPLQPPYSAPQSPAGNTQSTIFASTTAYHSRAPPHRS